MPTPLALITGASSGIGREFAEQLAASGHDLVLVARDAERLSQTAEELAGRHRVRTEVLPADLAVRADVDRVAARLRDGDSPVSLLVNNAGFGLKGRFLDNPVEAEQEMLDVLVTAVMRLSHAALPGMIDRQGGGIINVSSVASLLPRGTYGAAKAYVTTLSQWADATYRAQGVHIMTLLPGFTKTEMHQRMGVSRSSAPRWLWLDAERLVRDALADYAKGRRTSIPGKRYKAIAAFARYVPTGLIAKAQSLGRR
jgi:hypothetical protein